MVFITIIGLNYLQPMIDNIIFHQTPKEDLINAIAAKVIEGLKTSSFSNSHSRQREILSQKQTAKRLGCSEQFLINRRHAGKISCIPAGNKIKYDLDHLTKELSIGRRLDYA